MRIPLTAIQLSADVVPCKHLGQHDQNVGSSWKRRELTNEAHNLHSTGDEDRGMEAVHTSFDVFERSNAVREPGWKRSPIHLARIRSSKLASKEEANNNLAQRVSDSHSADTVSRLRSVKRTDLPIPAQFMDRIRGPRSVDLIDHTKGERYVDPGQDEPHIGTHDALWVPVYNPGRVLGEKDYGYLRYIGAGVHSKRDPEPVNKGIHSPK